MARRYSGVWVLLLATALAGAGEEPAAVKCPVPKPKEIPSTVQATFSTAPEVTFEARRKELEKLRFADRDEPAADALRWLVHQPVYGDELRNEALMVLGSWNIEWMADDLLAMMQDPAQAKSWRTRCVQHLGLHLSAYNDETSYQGLLKAAESPDPALYDPAVYELGRADSQGVWDRVQPERHAKVLAKIKEALGGPRPGALVAGIRAVATLQLRDQAAVLERLAGGEEQAPEVRVAAAQALAAVARAESLAVLETCSKSPLPALAQAALASRTYALAAQLEGGDAAAKQQAFEELAKLGEKALPSLDRLMNQEETEAQKLAKTLIARILVGQAALQPIDRTGMKHLGEDPKTKNPGAKNVLFNPESRLVALEGEFLLEQGALEYGVVCKGENAKLHESVLALDCAPLDVCFALLACNYTYAGELRENGKINLPKGAGVMLSVEYEHETVTPAGTEKKIIRLPFEHTIWNANAGRPMKRVPWAFTGSRIQKMQNGQEVLMAVIEKSVAAIMSDPNAILNTPLESAEVANVNPQQGAYYEINRAVAPKRGTKCWLIFEPWTGDLKAEDVKDRESAQAAILPPEPEPKRE